MAAILNHNGLAVNREMAPSDPRCYYILRCWIVSQRRPAPATKNRGGSR